LLFAVPLTAQDLVIDGGTVHTLAGEPFVGRVVIHDGLIAAVGPDAEAPAGAATLDAAGLHVYPGMFDAFGQLGLTEVGAISATVDTTELGRFNPHLRAATAFHPASEVIPVTRANGITQAVVAPRADRDGVIAGQAALVSLDGWTVEEMAVEPSLAMVISWPAIRTRSFDFSTFTVRETPFSEARDEADEARAELARWLDAARHYARAMAASSERAHRDLRLEALAGVLDGAQPVIVVASRQRDIEAAVAFAETQGLRMILAGGEEAWKVKELLAEKKIPVILGRVQDLPAEDDDPYDRPFRNAGELAAAGISIAFGSGAGGGFGPGGPHSARTLPWESAMAAAYGLSRDEALAALTVHPARILGVDDRLGTIEAGKIANLFVSDGDPLEITTQVLHLVIAGREVSTDNRHHSLYKRYRARP
jgi:imidazolonepropionase-like amidohydrolase